MDNFCILEKDGRFFLFRHSSGHAIVTFTRTNVPEGAVIIGNLSSIGEEDLITLISIIAFIEASKVNVDINNINFRISNYKDISATKSFLELLLKFQILRTNHAYADIFSSDGKDYIDIVVQPRRKKVSKSKDVTAHFYSWINYIMAECLLIVDDEYINAIHSIKHSSNANILRNIVVRI